MEQKVSTATGAKQLRLSRLCQVLSDKGLSARVEGADCLVSAVNTLADACPGEIAFLSNRKYLPGRGRTKAADVVHRGGIVLPE